MSTHNGNLRILVVNAEGTSPDVHEALAVGPSCHVDTTSDPEKALELLASGAEHYRSVLIDAGHAGKFARLLNETKRRVEQLETLRRTTSAITAPLDLDTLLHTIIRQAIELLHAKNGGVYKYNPVAEELVLIADHEHPEHVGSRWSGGGGMAWELVRNGHHYKTDAHYGNGSADAGEYQHERHHYPAVLEVPLRWLGENIGIAYLEDEAGREFTLEEARLFGLFADQTAIALGNAELNMQDERKLKSLEKLAKATKEIMGDLGSTTLDDRLTLIAKHAADILEAEVCYVHLVKSPGVLHLVASHGHRPGGFHKGKEFLIHSGPRTGLIGHIAHEGKLFNEHGVGLRDHFAVRGEHPPHSHSGVCHSMVAYPLKRNVGGDEELIGLLSAENKKDAEGYPRSALEFTSADEWILKVFGEAVVVALDSAALVGELSEQRDHLNRLVASSPSGIIATDERGHITSFNERARQILGYSEGEAVGTPMASLYADPESLTRINRGLDVSRKGIITEFEAIARAKSGEAVPIRQSSTRLYDARGKRVSTVHYFEDMRSLREAEVRLQFLLKATHVVAKAENLTDGLQSLAEMLGTLLPHTYCRILLMDESQTFMTVEAAYPGRLSDDHARGAEDKSHVINFEDWPGLLDWVHSGRTRLLHWAHPADRSVLKQLSKLRGGKDHVQSLMLVPFTHEGTALGMLEFGGLSSKGPRSFSPEEIEFATAIAEKNINLIDRMRLHSLVEQREHLLTKLSEASLHIRGEREPGKLLQEVVRLGVELVGCHIGGIYVNIPGLQVLERHVTYNLPEGHAGERLAHHEGLIGHTACSGKSYVSHAAPGQLELGFDAPNLRACATIPLKNEASEVEAVLFVASDDSGKRLSLTDIEMLDRFAAQAAIALQTSRLVTREQRDFERGETLHKIGKYIQVSKDLRKTLHVMLTGITAGYGLRLNCAAIFFLEGQGKFLVGKSGIGHFDERLARGDWARDQEYGVNDFAHYIELLEHNALPQTPIGGRIENLRIPVEDSDIFACALRERVPRRIGREEWGRLPEDFVAAFDPDETLAVVPLEVADHKFGLLVVDNRFTHAPITDEDLNRLHTFANAAATAAHNVKLLEENRTEREKLHSLLRASSALTSSHDPHQVLRDVIEQPPIAADAAWVRVILIDKMGQPHNQILGGTDKEFELKGAIRPNGISMQVMTTGEPVIIEDTSSARERINPFLINEEIKAALCLPFSLYDRPIGVVWINYREPRTFYPYEIEALQLYVNHAAIAYDNARKMDELLGLHHAASAMAGAFNPWEREQRSQTTVEHVLQTIVERARTLFKADSSTLWSYDQGQQKFLPNELRAVGIPKADLQVFRDEEPDTNGATYTALKRGWLSVEDTADVGYDFIRPKMRELLQSSGVRSFQGIALKVGEEPVGVLYVGYSTPRSFSDGDRPSLENFATYAALSLKNARLVDQVIAAKRATEIIAQESVLGDHTSSLQSVADATLKGAECDAVILYAYDQRKNAFSYPPIHAGVRYSTRAWPGTKVPATSMVYDIIKQDQPEVVERVAEREEFYRRFAREEEIRSCVAIPLLVGTHRERVGVMFVNYRSHRRFRAEELANIKLCAAQAAVAIRNWQVYEQTERQRREQEALVNLSKGFLGTEDESKILGHAVETAAKMLGVDFCHIVMPDKGGRLVFRAAHGWAPEMVHNYRVPGGDESQTGRTIKVRAPVVVHDYAKIKGRGFTVPRLVHELEIKSGMSVPIFDGEEVCGAMLVHSKTKRHFSEDEVNMLTLIATQTTIALQSAERYRSLDMRNASLHALCEASTVLSEGFGLNLEEVLGQIVKQAVTGITGVRGSEAVMGTLQYYDAQTQELIFVSVYPPERHSDLLARIGERWSIDPEMAPGGRIGITGKTVHAREPQLVPDVSERPEYITYNESTKSELAVPLWDQDQVIGVLNVESDELGGFGENDKVALKIFSDMAVTAINKAQDLEALRKERAIVGGRTALAWMGMTSTSWCHGVRNHAAGILNNVQTLRLQGTQAGDLPAWVDEYLDDIRAQAGDILAQPITPPLSSEEGIEEININDLLAERLKQLEDTGRYESITFGARPDPNEVILVCTCHAWMRLAFDHLVDNAAKAVAQLDPDRRVILVECHALDAEVELVVSDRGKGIPDEVRQQIFSTQVKSKEKSEGLGMGLLMAEAIVETYGGRIYIKSTGSEGTSMAIRLPRRIS